jgi:arginyl-tRNA synthetase
LGSLRYGNSSASIEVSDDLSGYVREALRRSTDGISEKLDEAAKDVYKHAVSQWPVKTGTSKAAMEQGLRFDGDTVEAFVGNDVPYVWYIRTDGVHQWTEHVRKPFDERTGPLLEDLGDEVLAALRGS